MSHCDILCPLIHFPHKPISSLFHFISDTHGKPRYGTCRIFPCLQYRKTAFFRISIYNIICISTSQQGRDKTTFQPKLQTEGLVFTIFIIAALITHKTKTTMIDFNNWDAVIRTIILGIILYVILVLFLRISGKRTLSKWNAFDFIVTVAFGSVLSSAILSNNITVMQGAAAFGILILLQFLVTWLSARVKFIRKVVKADPKLLLFKGQFLQDSMKKERVTESEVLAAVRESGIYDLDKVGAVILETDGSFSVVSELGNAQNTSLKDVK